MKRPYYKPDPVGGPEQYIGAEHKLNEPWAEQAHNVKLVGHSDLNGWGCLLYTSPSPRDRTR